MKRDPGEYVAQLDRVPGKDQYRIDLWCRGSEEQMWYGNGGQLFQKITRDNSGIEIEPFILLNGPAIHGGALAALSEAIDTMLDAHPTVEVVAELRKQLDRAEARVDLIVGKALDWPSTPKRVV